MKYNGVLFTGKKKLIVILLIFAVSLFGKPIAVTSEQVESVLGKSPKLIDIRQPHEWKEIGMIPNSYKMTFFDKNGKQNLPKWLVIFQRVVKSPDQPFGLVSTYTKDAKFVANILSSMGYRKVYYLEGGITDWVKNSGRVIDPDNRPTLKK